MRPSHFSRPLFNSLCLLVAYMLLISLYAPFALRRVEAAPAAPKPVKASPSAAAKAVKKGGRRDGELIIRFRDGVSELDKKAVVEGKGARRAKRLRGRSRLEKLEMRRGRDVEALAADLRKSPLVEIAEPNYLISRDDLTPNDPRFSEQWALRNTGATGGQPGADIQAMSAWETTTGSPATVIAVIDSGIDFAHPDLQNNLWTNSVESDDGSDNDNNGLTDDLHGWDWISDNGSVTDEQGHGTAVAGIIASQGDNGIGTAGVMWRAGLMSLRVLDNTGTGDVADAVEAIDYAADHGAQVINCSWGTDEESLALKDAIQRAGTKGVVIVSSAGNGGRDIESAPYYPSSFGLSNQLAVAATDSLDHLTSWSNYGGTHVTIAAPGVDILTTKMGGGYTTVTGTSAAAPVVTGVAGLIKTQHWWLSAAGTRDATASGARRVAELTGRVSSGGVLSAAGALATVEGSGPEPTPTPGTGGNNPPSTGGEPNTGSPGANMPDLDAERDRAPSEPVPPTYIHADLPCLDCEPCGGSCGGEIPGDPDFSVARTQPENNTGAPGVTLGSRNFNWSLPVVSLDGRSGHNLNLSLTYNSLVWTKEGSSVKFDADRGQPTAGFRIGLPTLQQRFYNPQTGLYAYIMVSPSGGRTELRQVGTSNIYETANGSHAQMTDNGTSGAVVRTSDGTQLTFVPSINNEMRCTKITDHNGNYISALYNASGRIVSITDTLSRVITFSYDTGNYLISITQTWNGVTHEWAKFYYGSLTIQTNFTGLSVVGPQNGTAVGVLNQVWLHGGERYYFDYTSWGQVWKIRHHAADNHQLSYTGYNLPGSPWLATSAQTDCPRFTQRRNWAQDWTGANGLPAEAITTYVVDPAGAWSQQTTPDNVTYKELYATTGWQRGLTTGTKIIFGGVEKKRTTTTWAQDDTSLGYPKNPRPAEIIVEDIVGEEVQNKRRVTINYYTAASYNLPSDVYEYEADGTTVLRRTHTDYNLTAPYTTTRRIIGLPSMKILYDGANNIVSKIEYQYDEGGAFFDGQDTPGQHDSANYGPSFIAGRGNLTSVRRWDAEHSTDAAKVLESNTGYNIAGSVILTRDPRGHQNNLDYTDNFSDGVNRNTLAYLKTVTDADGFTATVEYNYDTGSITKSKSPASGTGASITYEEKAYEYVDGAGRLTKITNLVNGAYTRWVYPTTNVLVRQYQTINDATEAYSALIYDGTGRVRATSREHTFTAAGAVSTYSGQYFIYDVMGRLWKKSNPTQMTSGWVPTGADASVGWQYTFQTYDWKSRPLVTTNPDATTRSNTYSGCGCAGGEQVTATDERGRQRRLGKDVLGRLSKVEELNFNGTVYSTTTYTYDATDHLTEINQAGQLRSFGYDGYGRLISRTTPEQGTTIYAYNTDDTLLRVTDARGATQTFAYNNRHLTTNIGYGVPAGVAATPNVTLAYDSAGNRTSMVEKNTAYTVVGSSTYHYDSMSRLDWEERLFPGVGTYRLGYAYNLAGGLTSVTGPSQFGSVEVGYDYDQMGRMTAVNGSGYGGVTSYVNNISYRAWGGLKQITYGNAETLTLDYDTRLRLTKWEMPGVMRWNYAYSTPLIPENTGRVAFADNLDDDTLDRSYSYDHVGRLVEAHSGNEASGHAGYTTLPASYTPTGPFSSAYAYDQFGNMTGRWGWGVPQAQYTNYYLANPPQFVNNRVSVNPATGLPMTYDAAGNLTGDGEQTFTYNAQGQQVWASGTNLTQVYDGDGLRVKKTESGVTTLYLRSSVLSNQVVAEISGSAPVGQMKRGYVYAGGQMVAIQESSQVNWVHQDPVTKSQRMTDSSGTLVSTFAVDVDPWGGETSKSINQSKQPHRYTTYERDGNGGDEAMFRRFESKLPRFSQPDPYDGSYNFAAPQSFNRYAYVQNDPVNFIDPSGLMISLSCDGRAFMGLENDQAVYTYFGCTIIMPWDGFNNDRGGRGSGGGGSEPTPQKPDYDNCYEFVEHLVNLIKDLVHGGSPNSMLRSLNTAAGQQAGVKMMKEAVDYKYINSGFEGFKDKLTMGFQGAGAYGHILYQAGAILTESKAFQGAAGLVGAYDDLQTNPFWTLLMRYPHNQIDQRRAEIEGNKAGINVGNIMSKFLKEHRDPKKLKEELESELCKPEGGLTNSP